MRPRFTDESSAFGDDHEMVGFSLGSLNPLKLIDRATGGSGTKVAKASGIANPKKASYSLNVGKTVKGNLTGIAAGSAALATGGIAVPALGGVAGASGALAAAAKTKAAIKPAVSVKLPVATKPLALPVAAGLVRPAVSVKPPVVVKRPIVAPSARPLAPSPRGPMGGKGQPVLPFPGGSTRAAAPVMPARAGNAPAPVGITNPGMVIPARSTFVAPMAAAAASGALAVKTAMPSKRPLLRAMAWVVTAAGKVSRVPDVGNPGSGPRLIVRAAGKVDRLSK